MPRGIPTQQHRRAVLPYSQAEPGWDRPAIAVGFPLFHYGDWLYPADMIRRHVGEEFFLIAQDDHAKLAGELARHFGNDRFARPEPQNEVIAGVSLHDAGWPLHDDEPTLNAGGLP